MHNASVPLASLCIFTYLLQLPGAPHWGCKFSTRGVAQTFGDWRWWCKGDHSAESEALVNSRFLIFKFSLSMYFYSLLATGDFLSATSTGALGRTRRQVRLRAWVKCALGVHFHGHDCWLGVCICTRWRSPDGAVPAAACRRQGSKI